MKILEQLWYDGLHPSEIRLHSDGPYSAQLDAVIKDEEKLLKMLPEEAKEAFEKLNDSKEELAAADRSKIFTAGFRLGARIMLEIMEDKK